MASVPKYRYLKNQFSNNLIQETIKIFKEEDGLELTPEMAEEYLQNMAGLFLAFAKGGVHEAPQEPVPLP